LLDEDCHCATGPDANSGEKVMRFVLKRDQAGVGIGGMWLDTQGYLGGKLGVLLTMGEERRIVSFIELHITRLEAKRAVACLEPSLGWRSKKKPPGVEHGGCEVVGPVKGASRG
jgi:hypothetical protein